VREHLPTCKVVVVVKSASREAVAHATRLGAFDVCVKPVGTEDLVLQQA
jgi:DNA-binding NtrC family response regulator